MKLLGLSKLPPDATRADHYTLLRQQRSARKEIAKSASPPTLQRGGSSSKLLAITQGKSAGTVSPREGTGSLPVTPESRRALLRRDREPGGAGDEGGICGGGGGEGGGVDLEEIIPHTEWLDMKESTLKLAPADIDDQFLRAITDLMAQFPDPPTRDPAMDLSSPATLTIGRNRRGERRGLHGWHSQRRGFGGSDRTPPPQPQPQLQPQPSPRQQQKQKQKRHEEHLDQIHQQPLVEQQGAHRDVTEDNVPVRITYSHPDDVFLL